MTNLSTCDADDDADEATDYNDDKENISGVITGSRNMTTSIQREILDGGKETDGGHDETDHDAADDNVDDETDYDDETDDDGNVTNDSTCEIDMPGP